jgi:hypothetical protein
VSVLQSPSSRGQDAFYKSVLNVLNELPISRLPDKGYTLSRLCRMFQPLQYRPTQTDDYPEFAHLARNAAQHFRQMNPPQSAAKEFGELLAALDAWANALAPQSQESPQSKTTLQRLTQLFRR